MPRNGMPADAFPNANVPNQGAGNPTPMTDTSGPTNGAAVAQALDQGVKNLTGQELQLLRDAITPDLAMILTKMLGPEVGAYIAPFAMTSDDRAQQMAQQEGDMAMAAMQKGPGQMMGAGGMGGGMPPQMGAGGPQMGAMGPAQPMPPQGPQASAGPPQRGGGGSAAMRQEPPPGVTGRRGLRNVST